MYEFVVYTSSQSGNKRWQLISKLAQFTDVHFPDLSQNLLKTYTTWNGRFKCLHATRSVNYSASNQSLQFFSFSLQIRVITSFFQVICSINGIFCTWARLFVFLASCLPLLSLFSYIYVQDLIPNVRSTINGKKANTNL